MKHWLEALSQKFSKHPSRMVAITVLLTLLLFAPLTWTTVKAYGDFNRIIKYEFRLRTLSDRIAYLDEVLTMSARMNAATGDRAWEQRYRRFEPQLDTALEESVRLAPEAYSSLDAEKTDAANKQLVAIEYRSFERVKEGRSQEALSLLSSPEYIARKQDYAEGIAKRNLAIQERLQENVATYRQDLLWASLTSTLSFILLLPAWGIVLRSLKKDIAARRLAQKALEEANKSLSQRTAELTQTLRDLKQTQSQLIHAEKMSSLGRVVAGIAHEINNPVSFVTGNLVHVRNYTQELLQFLALYAQQYPQANAEIQAYAEEIDLDFLVEDLAKSLQSMESGTERIRKIVLSLRNFSRLDEAECKAVDLRESIENTLLLLQHRLKGTSNRPAIQVIRNYGNLPLVECYPGQLNQVFMNILGNAIDALEDAIGEGEENPSIWIATEITSDRQVVIRFKDNGPGIPKTIQSKLFDPFFTTKEVGKGTGLGLSVSYQIVVETHQGSLTFCSEQGKGTEFTIVLPPTGTCAYLAAEPLVNLAKRVVP